MSRNAQIEHISSVFFGESRRSHAARNAALASSGGVSAKPPIGPCDGAPLRLGEKPLAARIGGGNRCKLDQIGLEPATHCVTLRRFFGAREL